MEPYHSLRRPQRVAGGAGCDGPPQHRCRRANHHGLRDVQQRGARSIRVHLRLSRLPWSGLRHGLSPTLRRALRRSRVRLRPCHAVRTLLACRLDTRVETKDYDQAMNRRSLFKTVAAAGIATLRPARAAIPKMKITRVRAYSPPQPNQIFNQSNLLVTVETDAGITGIGQGGSRHMLEQRSGRLIGS